jgi:hypothetical protein
VEKVVEMRQLLFILLFILLLSSTVSGITIASNWQYEPTVPTLAERVVALEKEVALRAHQSDEALRVAVTTMERRLAGMNEFRAALKDQAGTFVSRTELIAVAGIIIAFSSLLSGMIAWIFRIKP